MAEKNINYPVISTSRWWVIRKRFIRSIPERVTDTYLSGILSVLIGSARNIISPLRRVGLIDAEGKPTERAKRWRDDEQYSSVCQEILKEVYPSEILDTFPDATSPRTSVERWFASKTGLGQSVVGQMASFYLPLCEADPTKQENTSTSTKTTKNGNSVPIIKKSATAKAVQAKKDVSNETLPQMQIDAEEKTNSPIKGTPSFESSLYINIQIHISPDASGDQIDQIFSSMAKHLPSLQR